MGKRIRTGIGLAAAVLALSFAGFAALAPEGMAKQPETGGYLLRAYCGRVAIYGPNGRNLMETTDIELKNLPSADQNQLKSGIFIEDQGKLAQILEDLGS